MHPRFALSLALLVALLASTFDATPAFAQSPEDEVRAVIDQIFDGMRAGDSTMVSAAFFPGALMGRATDQGLRTGSNERWLNAIGTPHDEVWDEKIWNVKIMVDQRLASAWMEYAFYLGENLHHCGVNSMQFYKADDGWKVAYLVDTDRGMECGDMPDNL